MVAGRPYYQAYPADFFVATQGYDLETKGAYRLIIDLLNERDRAIPDEPKFIAGILGCSIQKWKKIRESLLDAGKLMPTEDGLHLTNPRFEREHAERAEKRAAAQMNGHLGGLQRARNAGQIDMELDAPRTGARTRTESPRIHEKVARKFGKSSKKVSSDFEEIEPTSQENNDLGQDPLRLRTRAKSPESKSIDSSQPISDSSPARPGRLDNADLKTLYDEVCAASGLCPIQPAAIDRAMTQVEKWRELGIDFETVVIPSIRAVVLSTDEPTRTLARFNARIMHEHAKAVAAAKRKVPYQPPKIPMLNPEGEDPMFLPLRADLLEKVGDKAYCMAFNDVRFSNAGGGQLRLNGMQHHVEPLRHGRWKPVLLSIARPHGFEKVW